MYIYYIITIILFISCTSPQKQSVEKEQLPHVIDMSDLNFSDTPQNLSEFADSISYIRLSDEPLIPDIAYSVNLYIDKNENIYIDKDLIYKYSSNGKFTKSLFKRGQGPEEIALMLSAVYCENYVIVNDYGSESFKKYSLNGEYLDKLSKRDGTKEKNIIGCISDKEIFHHSFEYSKRGDKVNLDGPYLWYVKDHSSDSIIYKMKNSFFHIKAEKGAFGIIDGIYPLYYGNIDSTFYIRHVNQDTLFKTTDALKWEPWYIIKHHKRDASYELLIRMMVGNALEDDVRAYYKVYEVYPLPTGILFSYRVLTEGNRETKIGFCKHGEKALTCSGNSFKNDLDDHLKSIKIPLLPHYQRNGYLYILVNAFDFFEEGAKSPFTDLTEESNPVLVKLKLKEYGKR